MEIYTVLSYHSPGSEHGVMTAESSVTLAPKHREDERWAKLLNVNKNWQLSITMCVSTVLLLAKLGCYR